MIGRGSLLDALATSSELGRDRQWLAHPHKGPRISLDRHLDHQPDANIFAMLSALGWLARRLTRLAGLMDPETLRRTCSQLGSDLVDDLDKRIGERLVANDPTRDGQFALQDAAQLARHLGIALDDHLSKPDDHRPERVEGDLDIRLVERASSRFSHGLAFHLTAAIAGLTLGYIAARRVRGAAA